MKTKQIPALIMLLGGAVTSIVMYLMHYDIKSMLFILLAVLIGFYIFGVVIKKIFDSFKFPTKDDILKDGEVIEKDNEEDAEKTENNGEGKKAAKPDTEKVS